MQKDGSVSSIPILRLPICSTNMRIIRWENIKLL
jgi:hypothetical protein